MNDAVSQRLFAAKMYQQGLIDGELSDSTRDNYRKSIPEWNYKLQSISFTLNAYELDFMIDVIEKDIHNHFLALHNIFNEKKNKKVNQKDINEMFFYIKAITINVKKSTSFISNYADESWGTSLVKKDALTKENLFKASNITLLKRIFNCDRSSLGVKHTFDN